MAYEYHNPKIESLFIKKTKELDIYFEEKKKELEKHMDGYLSKHHLIKSFNGPDTRVYYNSTVPPKK